MIRIMQDNSIMWKKDQVYYKPNEFKDKQVIRFILVLSDTDETNTFADVIIIQQYKDEWFLYKDRISPTFNSYHSMKLVDQNDPNMLHQLFIAIFSGVWN
jgi:hypothetical protein